MEEQFTENHSDMTPIEQKQIRGVTMKTLWAIITSTTVIVGTVLTGSNNIRNEILLIKKDQETAGKINELKIREIEARMSAIEADNKELHYRLQRIESRDGQTEK